MHRTLYVLVYPSRLFAAHWSFWIPYHYGNGQESNVGDRIHVTGDRLHGFEYEYVQNYNVREDDRNPKTFAIGVLSAESLGRNTEGRAVNAFDRVCQEVPAPGPSLNKVNSADHRQEPGNPPKRAETKDCQWWIKQAIVHLVEAEMLLPIKEEHGEKSLQERVESLPRH